MGNGKVAVVTGAGSGIGRAVALGLQGEGYDVALAGRRKIELARTSQMAKAVGGRILPIETDVTQPTSVATLFKRTIEAFGRVDLLFNNAGVSAPAVPMEELTAEQWRSVVDVNLSGSFYCAQEAIKAMKAQTPKGGRIINNGSISAHVPRPLSAPYTATKHAITGLTRSISLDCRRDGITCGQIDIGNAATEMTKGIGAGRALQADGERRPEAVMDVENVVRAVVYMASLPPDANVLFLTVMANAMPFVGRG
jgi:NAD(P)-dependent dehydrogenase (short-subunit alcohol dehydrogenase family)